MEHRQPFNFIDSENFIIKNNIPYFYFPGNSYRDKLKNGLSLEYMVCLENTKLENEETVKTTEDNKINLQKTNTIDYEDSYSGLVGKNKYRQGYSGKENNKIRKPKTKKINIKLRGYSDKLFYIKQHTVVTTRDDEFQDEKYNVDDNSLYDNDYDHETAAEFYRDYDLLWH